MSHSLRFLGFAVAAWVGVRALSLGVIPGAEALAFDRPSSPPTAGEASLIPPLMATELAPVAPAPTEARAADGVPLDPGYPPAPTYYPAAYPAPYPVAAAWPAVVPRLVMPRPRQSAAARYQLAALGEGALYYPDPIPQLDDWPLARIASASRPQAPVPAPASSAAPAKLDRLQMTAWAMLRDKPGPASLASGGTLGGSQAGARLLWRFSPRIAASLRSTAPLGVGTRGGGEAAAGVRYQPFASLPVALTAERRFAFGPQHGRSAFALFAEGGVYGRPIIAGFDLDAYLQAGVVGARDRMAFVDGSAALTRPIWRNLSGGLGIWGGAQPGVTRLDAGPRLSLRVGRSIRVHADYRHKLVGNAQPGSGPVVTLAADF